MLELALVDLSRLTMRPTLLLWGRRCWFIENDMDGAGCNTADCPPVLEDKVDRRSPLKPQPCWRMIARPVPAAHVPVHASRRKPPRCRAVEQQVVQPQPRFPWPSLPLVVAELYIGVLGWSVFMASVHPCSSSRRKAARGAGCTSIFGP
jgi:hypothetical protein